MKMEIYVDGSYTKNEPDVTKGAAIILVGGKPVVSQRFKTKKKSFVSGWNVGGELMAAIGGLLLAGTVLDIYKASGELHVYYDYMGIEKFATREWKAKEPGPILYVQILEKFKSENGGITLHWHKTKAHAGVKWNVAADALAGGVTPDGCGGCRLPDLDEFFEGFNGGGGFICIG